MGNRLVLVVLGVLVLGLAGSPPAPSAGEPSRISSVPSATTGSHALGLRSNNPTSRAASGVTPALSEPATRQRTKGHTEFPFKIEPLTLLGSHGGHDSKNPFFMRVGRSRIGTTSTSTPAPRIAAASPAIVLYNGLNKTGETATPPISPNDGAPPDSTGAIGPNNYVEMANSSIAVYDRSLNLITSASLDSFAGQLSTVPLCDVQIQWDGTANRWLFAFLYCGSAPNNQGFVFGWSKTSGPTNLSTAGWCFFFVSTTSLLFDYPKLGHNRNFLIVGGNVYANPTTSTPSFVSAAIGWSTLPSNGSVSCTTTFNGTSIATPLKDGDGLTNAYTPVPVNTTTSAANGYILSAYDPSGSNNNSGITSPQGKLAVWHLDSAGALHQDPDITVNQYDAPFSAPQSGTSDVLDTLDGRLTQAVGDPVTGIWTQHTVNGLGNRSEVDWYEVTFPASFPNPMEMGSVSSATDWVFNAAISPESDAQGAAIFYNRSSPTTLPLIVAQIRRAATPGNTMEPGELILATSPAADTDFTCTSPYGPPCRWGDYSGASPDPVQPNVVWGTSEFNTASGLPLNAAAWSDENFAVLVAVPPHSPTAIAATPEDSAARVAWTPSSFDAGASTTSYTVRAYVGGIVFATNTVPGSATAMAFYGLTNGVTYTFTVIAVNVLGPSPESAHSNPVTPTRAVLQAPPSTPGPRQPVNQAPSGSAGAR